MNHDATVPPLRPGVRLAPAPSADAPDAPPAGVVEDLVLGRRVRLDPRGFAVASALDGPQPLDALAARLAADPDAIARVVASFDRLHLLATPTATALAADAAALDAVRAAPAADVPVLVRPDARFTCTMCGSCCGGHNVGPVFQDVLDGLAPHAAELERATATAKGLFFAMGGDPDAPDRQQVLCHQSRGSCIFLMDDRRCRIHAALGGDRKPRACRIFPYEFVATPRGVAVTIQRECRGLVEARAGKALADDLPAIRRLLALAPELTSVRRVVSLAPDAPVAWATYERLEDALHAAVDAHADDPVAALLACRHALTAAVADARQASPAATAGDEDYGADDVATLRRDLDALTDALLAAIAPLREAVPEPTADLLIRADALDHLRDALRGLRDDLRRVVAPPARPDQRDLARDHLHHAFMAKTLATARTAEVGLARLVFGWLLTNALAVHRARQVKRRHLVAQDLMDALVVTSFLWRHQDLADRVLPAFDDDLVDLFVHRLPALLAHAAALPDPDQRLELTKF